MNARVCTSSSRRVQAASCVTIRSLAICTSKECMSSLAPTECEKGGSDDEDDDNESEASVELSAAECS